MNPQAIILVALKLSIVVMVVAIGLKASLQDATYLFRRPGQLIRVVLAMNVLLPMVVIAGVTIFDLTPAVESALVALALSPVPPILPNKALKAGGTESYTIGLLVAASVLSIIIIPLTLTVLEVIFKVPLRVTPGSVAIPILTTVIGPLILGIAIRSFAPAFADRTAKPASSIATVILGICLLVILFAVGPALWSLVGNGTLGAICAFVFAGLLIGHLLGGPNPENRTVLALATATRHPAVALALAHANFPQQKMAPAAVLLFLLVSAIVAVPYLAWTKRRRQAIANA